MLEGSGDLTIPKKLSQQTMVHGSEQGGSAVLSIQAPRFQVTPSWYSSHATKGNPNKQTIQSLPQPESTCESPVEIIPE